MADQIAKQDYYTPTVPVEAPAKHPGRVYGTLAIVSAVISFLFFPIIFGPAGIILGVVAREKGDKTLGLVGIILSAVLMVLGFVFGFLAQTWFGGSGELPTGAAGLLFPL